MKVAIKKPDYIKLFFTVMACLICISGCKESVKSANKRYLVPDYSKVKFEEAPEPPPTAKTLYVMAGIFASAGNEAGCEAVMKRIIREYPDFRPVYNSLAELQLQQGRKKDAIETMNAGLSIYPQDTALLNNTGMCRLMCAEYEKALEMFTQASGLMPQNAKYRANMAVTLGLMGHYDESLALFRQILSDQDADYNVNVLRQTAMGPEPLKKTDTGQINKLNKKNENS